MKKILVLVLAFAMLITLSAASVGATTGTLKDAAEGQTSLVLEEGKTYTVDTSNPVELNGITITGKGIIEIDATNISGDGATGIGQLLSIGENVVLDGVTIQAKNLGVNTIVAIYIKGNGSRIVNCVIENLSPMNGKAFLNESGVGVEISNCAIKNFNQAMYVNETSGNPLTFSNNTVTSRDGMWGLNVAEQVDAFKVEGNSFGSNLEVGIYLDKPTETQKAAAGELSTANNNAKVQANNGDGSYSKVAAVSSEAELKAALEDADVKEIKLIGDITVSGAGLSKNGAAIVINRALVIDGNGKSIIANKADWTPALTPEAPTNGSNVINVLSNDVTIKNLTVNGDGAAKHGINVFSSKNVSVDNVSSKNNFGVGLAVIGSEVVANNLKTENNGWGGVNVDSGSVGATPKFAIKGSYTTSGEKNGIYIDADETVPAGSSIGDYVDLSGTNMELVKDETTGQYVVKAKTTPTPTPTPTPSGRPNPSTGVSF